MPPLPFWRSIIPIMNKRLALSEPHFIDLCDLIATTEISMGHKDILHALTKLAERTGAIRNHNCLVAYNATLAILEEAISKESGTRSGP